MHSALLLFALFLAAAVSSAQTALTEPADKLLREAQARAAREKKAVLVVFGASWCEWSRKLDRVLVSPAVRRAMEGSFVTVALTVRESPDKKVLENPGAERLLEKNGGKGAGLPFFYFADAKGNLIMNSIRHGDGQDLSDKGGNIGCPYEPKEVFWLIRMVHRAAPKMADEDRLTIQRAFESLKEKGG